LDKQQNICPIMSLTARLTSAIFQQYKIGFRVEFNNISVAAMLHAKRNDGFTPVMIIKAITIPMGR